MTIRLLLCILRLAIIILFISTAIIISTLALTLMKDDTPEEPYPVGYPALADINMVGFHLNGCAEDQYAWANITGGEHLYIVGKNTTFTELPSGVYIVNYHIFNGYQYSLNITIYRGYYNRIVIEPYEGPGFWVNGTPMFLYYPSTGIYRAEYDDNRTYYFYEEMDLILMHQCNTSASILLRGMTWNNPHDNSTLYKLLDYKPLEADP